MTKNLEQGSNMFKKILIFLSSLLINLKKTIKFILEKLKYVIILIFNFILKKMVALSMKYAQSTFHQKITFPLLEKVIKKPFHKVSKPIKYWYSFKLNNQQRRTVTGYLFLAPYIIGALVFMGIPLVFVIYMSFNKVVYDGTTSGYNFEWIGLQNYINSLLIDIEFVIPLQDYIVQMILYVPLIITLAIIIAVLLNAKLKGTSFFRLIFFLPVLSLSASFLQTIENFGGLDVEVNGLLSNIINQLVSSPEAYMLVLEVFTSITTTMWFTAVPALIFLAALQKVDTKLYEAAQMDGASPWFVFWKITLPSIWSLISVAIIYTIVFMGNFEGNPINQLIIEISNTVGKGGKGAAAAIALSFTAIQMILIGIFLYLTKPKMTKGTRG